MSKESDVTPVSVLEPATRAGFLRRAGLGGAALVGGGVLLGARERHSPAIRIRSRTSTFSTMR